MEEVQQRSETAENQESQKIESTKKLAAALKTEVKKLSHNELSRQFVNLYTANVLMQKQLDDLKAAITDVGKVEQLLEQLKKYKVESELKLQENINNIMESEAKNA